MEDNKWQRGMKNVNPSIPILHPWFQNKDSGTVNSHPSHAIILTYPLLSLQLWPAETFDSGTDPWLCNEPFLRGSARVICDRGIRFFFRAMRSALSFDLERETRRVQGSLCVSFDSSFIFLLGRGTIIFGRIFGHTFSNDQTFRSTRLSVFINSYYIIRVIVFYEQLGNRTILIRERES